MKIGDVIVNPHVRKNFVNKPNPLYQSMVIHIGKEYTTTLRYDGKTSKYYTREVKEWEVLHNVSLYEMIYEKYLDKDSLFESVE